jgi:hypothetical protein
MVLPPGFGSGYISSNSHPLHFLVSMGVYTIFLLEAWIDFFLGNFFGEINKTLYLEGDFTSRIMFQEPSLPTISTHLRQRQGVLILGMTYFEGTTWCKALTKKYKFFFPWYHTCPSIKREFKKKKKNPHKKKNIFHMILMIDPLFFPF